MAAVIANRQRRISVAVPRLARSVDRALAAVGRPAGVVEVAIVDDAEIRRLNSTYRGIARRTDVLAFPLETPEATANLVGQVVVSADTAVRQARRLGVPVALELDLLLTHGVLHLVGYDDRDPVEAVLMHRREREIMTRAPERLWTGLLHRDPETAHGSRRTAISEDPGRGRRRRQRRGATSPPGGGPDDRRRRRARLPANPVQ